MKNKRVKFKRFIFGEGWVWNAGDEGVVIAETDTFYKVKTGWLSSEWVYKSRCEEIKLVESNTEKGK